MMGTNYADLCSKCLTATVLVLEVSSAGELVRGLFSLPIPIWIPFITYAWSSSQWTVLWRYDIYKPVLGPNCNNQSTDSFSSRQKTSFQLRSYHESNCYHYVENLRHRSIERGLNGTNTNCTAARISASPFFGFASTRTIHHVLLRWSPTIRCCARPNSRLHAEILELAASFA